MNLKEKVLHAIQMEILYYLNLVKLRMLCFWPSLILIVQSITEYVRNMFELNIKNDIIIIHLIIHPQTDIYNNRAVIDVRSGTRKNDISETKYSGNNLNLSEFNLIDV